jgi:hypothetical protein
MDGDVLKLALTALGSGSVVTVLLKVLSPAMKLSAAGNEASTRAISQWEKLYESKEKETAAAHEAAKLAREEADKAEARADVAEKRAGAAERKTAKLEMELDRAVEQIRLLQNREPKP